MKAKLFYKMGITFMMLFVIIIFTRCQKTGIETENKTTVVVDSLLQEEKDWEDVKAIIYSFCDTPEECERYNKSNFLESRMFEEKIHKRKLIAIENFLFKYPQSNYYFEALKLYFSYLIEPRFISSTISQSKKLIVNQHTKKGQDYSTHKYQQFRTLPFDIKLRNNWLNKGDSLVGEYLNFEESLDKKATIEVAALGRDQRMARYLYEFLHLDKKEEEAEYWFLFDNYFWGDFIKKMDLLIYKYPDYPKWPVLVDKYIFNMTEHFLSPELTKPFWEHFQEITNRPELFVKHPIIEEIHEKAEKNLRAIEALNVLDESQPLKMDFISIDGKKVDIADYRGKVVLIDFWSIRCAPCIKEMPHIRKLYDKYKAQGFEVVGVSAEGDNDKEQVMKVIRKQGANWPHSLDKGVGTIVSYHSLYKIHALPTTWLLDKKGIIVDKNARGDRLEPLIREYLEL